MNDPWVRWFCVLWLAALLTGVMIAMVFGCAPLPPPAPAMVELVTIQPGQEMVSQDALHLIRLRKIAETQEIARDQAQQVEEVSPWLVWLIVGGAFLLAFLWAIRAWPWNRSWRTHG